MRTMIIALALAVACSKKGEQAHDNNAAPPASDTSVTPYVTPKPALASPCPETMTDAQSKCDGALVTKVDKYAWTVTQAGTYELTLTQPDRDHGFRPVLIVWKDPDQTIKQDDVHTFGDPAHVSVKVEPGAYRVSVVNGSRGELNSVQPAFPYSLVIERK